MDHILQLHVQQHGSLKHCDPGVARFTKSVDAASRVVVLAFAAMASLALFLTSFSMGRRPLSSASTLPAWLVATGSSLVTTKAALFVLSNAIFVLLAANCRGWFFTTGASSTDVEPGDVLEKQGRHRQEEAQQCAVQSCVPVPSYQGCVQHKINSSSASHAFTDPVMVSGTDNTTTLQALEQQEEDVPVMSRPELLGLDEGDSIAVELETVVVEEPTCETAQGLDELEIDELNKKLDDLEIDELNKKFDEFIQSRRNKWIEETLLAVAPGLTC